VVAPFHFPRFFVALRRLPRPASLFRSPFVSPSLSASWRSRGHSPPLVVAPLRVPVVLRQAPARALATRRAGPLQHPYVGQLLLVRRQFRLRTRPTSAANQQCRHISSLPRFVWLRAICQLVYPFPSIPSSLFCLTLTHIQVLPSLCHSGTLQLYFFPTQLSKILLCISVGFSTSRSLNTA
jgi:hypothetical protein